MARHGASGSESGGGGGICPQLRGPLVFAKDTAVHPLVGDDPAVFGLLLLGHRLLFGRRGIPEMLHKAQSRMHLVLGEAIYQGVQAFSVGHGSS